MNCSESALSLCLTCMSGCTEKRQRGATCRPVIQCLNGCTPVPKICSSATGAANVVESYKQVDIILRYLKILFGFCKFSSF